MYDTYLSLPSLIIFLEHFYTCDLHNLLDDTTIQISGNLPYVMYSKRPLEECATDDEKALATSSTLPDLFPLLPYIDMKTINIYREQKNISGQYNFLPYF